MAFPINALLVFRAPGVQTQMAKTSAGFAKLKAQMGKASSQASGVATGLKTAAMASLPLGIAAGVSVKKFADFESQMSVVKSLTRGVTEEEFAAMGAEAKRLGATTAWTAKQAAEGFQYLALAGFNAQEQTESLEGVLQLASAGSLDLGRASDIATDSMSALAPAMDQTAGRAKNLAVLSDQMAFIQSKTNTNIEQLGEAIKYGGGSLAGFGFQLPDIIASIGALANAGLKGSVGGTALMNMFNKILKPSEKATDFMRKHSIALTDAEGKMRSMPNITKDLIASLDSIPNEADRSAMTIELFGLRGIRAYSALRNEGIDSIKKLSDGVAASTGEARRQAEERLNNLSGAFTRFSSAVSGVLIETGSVIGGFLRKPIEEAASTISNLAVAFQLASGSLDPASKGAKLFYDAMGQETGQKMVEFLQGFIEGIGEVKEAVSSALVSIKGFISGFSDGEMSAKEIGKLVTKIAAGIAIIGPLVGTVLLGFALLTPIISGVVSFVGLLTTGFSILVTVMSTIWSVISTIWAIAGVVFPAIGTAIAAIGWPITLIVAAIVGIGVALYVWRDQIWEVVQQVGQAFSQAWTWIKTSAGEAFTWMGNMISQVFTSVSETVNQLVTGMVDMFSSGFSWLVDFATTTIPNAFSIAAEAIMGAFGIVKNFMVGVGSFIFDALTFPIRSVLSMMKGLILKVADSAIGRKALSLAGVDTAALQGFIGKIPGVDAIDKYTGAKSDVIPTIATTSKASQDVARLQKRSIESKATVVGATQRSLQVINGGGESRGDISTTVNLKVDGRTLASTVARQSIENSERSGKQVSPIEKRKMIENGAFAQ